MSQIFTTKEITINGVSTPVRRDEVGRINLNELHRASGGLAKKAPAKFLRYKKAKTLIASLISSGLISPVEATEGGNGGGTYAHEDVAFAYAAWIDDAFYSVVFQVFGATVRGDTKKVKEIVRTAVRVEGRHYFVIPIETRKRKSQSPVAEAFRVRLHEYSLQHHCLSYPDRLALNQMN